MSGPKASSYTVSDNELRRRRAVAEALSTTEALVRHLQSAYATVDAFNHNCIIHPIEISREHFSVSQARQSDDLSRIEAYNRKIRAACSETTSTFEAERAAQTLEANLQQELVEKARLEASKLLKYTGKAETSADVIERYLAAERQKRQEKKYLSHKETAERILGRIPADIQPADKASIDAVAKRILDPENKLNKEAQIGELRLQVQKAKKVADKLAVEAKEAIAYLESLSGYDSPVLSRLKARLEEIAQKKVFAKQPLFTEAWRKEIEVAKAKAKAELDATYVQESISDVLKDLGYDVEDEFTTLFSKKESIRIQKPGWDEYFVQFRLTEGLGDINYNVVRYGDTAVTKDQKIQDQAMESKWCGDFSKLVQAMEAKGIQHQLKKHFKAGELPVQVIKDKKSKERKVVRKKKKPGTQQLS